MNPPIPDNARRLVSAWIPTVPHLEALVLAHANPAKDWEVAEIGQLLYVPGDTARSVLLDLVRARLMVVSRAEPLMARYAPADESLQQATNELVEVYTRRVVEVTRLIHAHEGDGAQRLADAFRVRRKK